MSQITRSFAAVVDDVKPAERSVVAKIGTRAVDRYKTVIEPRGIDLVAYRTNPVVLFEHGKDPLRGSLPIGRNQWVRVEKDNTERLIAKTIFGKDDFSAMLFDMYCDGTMRGWSVSILPKDASVPTREEIRSRPELANCELVYRSSELLEYSVTAVPGNPEAISQQELRSIARLVVRGFWSPNEEIKPLVDPIIKQMNESDDETDAEPDSVERTLTSEDLMEIDDVAADASAPEVVYDENGVVVITEKEFADRLEAEKRGDPDHQTLYRKAIEELGLAPQELDKLGYVELAELTREVVDTEDVVERTAPEPDPIVIPEAEPETAPEPEPVVEPKPELPPLVGRSFDEIVKEAVKSIDDFQKANTQRIQDLAGWFRGEA